MQIEDFQKLEFSTLKWIKPISYRLPFARSYRWPLMGPYSDPFKLPNNSIWDIIWRCFFDLLPNCAAIRAEKPLQFGRDYCTVCSHRQPASVFSLLYWGIVAMAHWKSVSLKLKTHKLYVCSRTVRGDLFLWLAQCHSRRTYWFCLFLFYFYENFMRIRSNPERMELCWPTAKLRQLIELVSGHRSAATND